MLVRFYILPLSLYKDIHYQVVLYLHLLLYQRELHSQVHFIYVNYSLSRMKKELDKFSEKIFIAL